ncbi:hypothetical protein LguiA_017867 [Lonicera macranthoides]
MSLFSNAREQFMSDFRNYGLLVFEIYLLLLFKKKLWQPKREILKPPKNAKFVEWNGGVDGLFLLSRTIVLELVSTPPPPLPFFFSGIVVLELVER